MTTKALRLPALATGLCLLALSSTAAASNTTTAAPYAVTVRDGFSVAGDGIKTNATPTSSSTGSLYDTPADGTLSLSSTLFSLIPSWPGRYLTLTIQDPRTGGYLADAAGTPAYDYRCEPGTLNAHSSSPLAEADGFLQCYNAARTLGFYVDWPPFPNKDGGGGVPCIEMSDLAGAPAGSRAIETSTGCMAHVSVRKGGTFTLQTEPGSKTPECFMVSFQVEAVKE